jgi:hypothetical protein
MNDQPEASEPASGSIEQVSATSSANVETPKEDMDVDTKESTPSASSAPTMTMEERQAKLNLLRSKMVRLTPARSYGKVANSPNATALKRPGKQKGSISRT